MAKNSKVLTLPPPNKVGASENKPHRVILIRDTPVEFPELWMEVFLAPDNERERALLTEMLARARCKVVDHPDKADLVIFGGGDDVNPTLYGEKRHRNTYYDSKRDDADCVLYQKCYDEGIPMFGICRGAQFGWVMHGGKLFQDVDGHVGDHSIWVTKEKRQIARVSSVHHQLCRPSNKIGAEVLADTYVSTERWVDDSTVEKGRKLDIEAYYIRDTCFLGVQGHPEYRGYHQYLRWVLECIDHYILCNPDLELRDNVRRMKKSLLEERKALRQENVNKNKELV